MPVKATHKIPGISLFHPSEKKHIPSLAASPKSPHPVPKPHHSHNKRLFMAVLFFILLILTSNSAARISGPCSNCHTMHNSQGGSSMKLDSTPNIPGTSECLTCHSETRAGLLRLDCLGCHAQNPDGASNIIDNVPQIAHNDTTMAAGNYRYVFTDDRCGHNVHGFGNTLIAQDSFLQNTPPGYISEYDPSTDKYQPEYSFTAPQIMCAGRNGCHGSRDELSQSKAMRYTHHGSDKVLKFGSLDESKQGATLATSYRFLDKIHGAEDDDWEATLSATDHNEYKGVNYSERTSQAWSEITTISQLCAECHGLFHSSNGIGDVNNFWLRHPTDIVLPDSGEYTNYTEYNSETPVGRQTLSGSAASASINHGSDTVICLSCHRAHGSPYEDILRWDYSGIMAGSAPPESGNGCFRCHSAKD